MFYLNSSKKVALTTSLIFTLSAINVHPFKTKLLELTTLTLAASKSGGDNKINSTNTSDTKNFIDSTKIIEYADRTRGAIPEGLEWTVKLISVDEGDTTEREYFIKYKNNDSNVECMAPAKSKGEVMLFKGRSLWYFKPGLRAPVAISARQKLSGTASNGDIASTNYSKDYTATFTKIESTSGEDSYLFRLKSKSTDTTYDQIDYWISKKSGLALRADFLSLQGKSLKSAIFKYDHHLTYKGETFPFISEMKITDSKNTSNQTTLIYSSPVVKSQPDSLFNVNNLKR